MSHNAGSSRDTHNPDEKLGAIEQNRPGQETNAAPLRAQMDHRSNNPLIKQNDTDYPEPGSNPEYSMQQEDKQKDLNRKDPDGNNPEGNLNDQDPGERQKENQNQQGDDPLAA